MQTRAYPYVQIAENTLEIGEFDCASMFLLVGSEKALLIDTGIGIGDLAGFIRQFTDLPLMVCYTHNHLDHVGGVGAFAEGWISPADQAWFASGGGVSNDRAIREGYVRMIAAREKGLYPYKLEEDLGEWGPEPVLHPLHDGMEIDLGGRLVRAVAVPGHTPGGIAFLDYATRSLFLGDACNGFLILTPPLPDGSGHVTVREAQGSLSKLRSLRPLYERMYNGHYDFRPLGQPLAPAFLDDAIAATETIVAGEAIPQDQSSQLPLGENMREYRHGLVRIAYDPRYIR